MSFYSFIATHDEMPEIDQTNVKYITVKEAIALQIKPHELVPWEEMDPNATILLVENEEDLHELVIKHNDDDDVTEYTSYPFIYEINFIYSEARTKQLLEYLKETIKEGQIVELWRVWIGDDEIDIPFSKITYEELSLQHLIPIYNWNHDQYQEQSCLVIER